MATSKLFLVISVAQLLVINAFTQDAVPPAAVPAAQPDPATPPVEQQQGDAPVVTPPGITPPVAGQPAVASTNAAPRITNTVESLRRAMQRSATNRPPRAAATNLAVPSFPPGGRRTTATPGLPAPGVPSAVAPSPDTARSVATMEVRTNLSGEIGEVTLKFNNAPLDQVLDEYARITGRTVLRPANLQSPITIITSTPLTREEAIQAMDGALSLNNIVMLPQGEKFVKAVSSSEAPKEGARIAKLGDEFPEAEQYVTHVVQLEIARPTEMKQMLDSFTKNPAGIVAIDSSQILVLRDYASNIRRMLELIEQVDVPPENDYRLEVIPIKYGKVTDLYDTMNALISGASGGGFTRSATQQRRPGSLPSAGTPSQFGAGNRYQRTSQGLGGGYNQPNQYYPQATQLQPAGTGAQSAAGGTFQQRLNQIVSRAAGESQVQVLGDARIVPDERSNSLIVFANKQDVQMITNIVAKVDVLLAQVLIEGIVLAVNIGDERDVGVSWLQNPKRFGQDFAGGGAINNRQAFLSSTTNFVGSLPSGFSYFGKIGDDVEVALVAIANDKKARVLQRPRIQTSHAVPGSFFTGQTVPYVTGFYNYGGYGSVGTQSQVEQLSVGSTLQVTPYITPDGLVVLDIYQDLSQVEGFTKIDNNDVPTTSSRNAQATLSVRDGDTIMLGGYIQESKDDSSSGVPFLKDIPGLGVLFRAKSHQYNRQEVMLFLQVTVLKTPSDAGAQAKIEKSRLPGIFEAFKDIQTEEDKAKRKAGMMDVK
jgi:general secretion pathway protein D